MTDLNMLLSCFREKMSARNGAKINLFDHYITATVSALLFWVLVASVRSALLSRHHCCLMDTRRRHERGGERRRQRMRPRQPAKRVRVVRPTHARGGGAEWPPCLQCIAPPPPSRVWGKTRTRGVGCLGRILCRRRSL